MNAAENGAIDETVAVATGMMMVVAEGTTRDTVIETIGTPTETTEMTEVTEIRTGMSEKIEIAEMVIVITEITTEKVIETQCKPIK